MSINSSLIHHQFSSEPDKDILRLALLHRLMDNYIQSFLYGCLQPLLRCTSEVEVISTSLLILHIMIELKRHKSHHHNDHQPNHPHNRVDNPDNDGGDNYGKNYYSSLLTCTLDFLSGQMKTCKSNVEASSSPQSLTSSSVPSSSSSSSIANAEQVNYISMVVSRLGSKQKLLSILSYMLLSTILTCSNTIDLDVLFFNANYVKDGNCSGSTPNASSSNHNSSGSGIDEPDKLSTVYDKFYDQMINRVASKLSSS